LCKHYVVSTFLQDSVIKNAITALYEKFPESAVLLSRVHIAIMYNGKAEQSAACRLVVDVYAAKATEDGMIGQVYMEAFTQDLVMRMMAKRDEMKETMGGSVEEYLE
jgi:hypothetical protein